MPKLAKFQNNSKNDPPSGDCALPRGTIFLSENFKNLEILQSKRDFFNFLQAINFHTFMLAKRNFLDMFYTGNTTGK